MKFAARLVYFLLLVMHMHSPIYAQEVGNKNYQQEFKMVDSLVGIGQPKLALALINSLNETAKTESNQIVLLKSAAYKMMFQNYLEEDAITNTVQALEQNIRMAEQPAKSILQSILAETYWKYYEQNRYRIAIRSELKEDNSRDLQTWSLKRLSKETIKIYMASLANGKQLQETKMDWLTEVLDGDTNTRYLRPTLYDLLAHRALSVLCNTQIELTNASNKIIDFSKPLWFMDSQAFAVQAIPTDSNSYDGQALLIFQKLLRFHLIHGDTAAVADLELNRLKFVNQRSLSTNKQVLYNNALENLAILAKNTEIMADIWVEQAQLLQAQKQEANSRALINAVELAQKAVQHYPNSNGGRNAAALILQINSKAIEIKVKEHNLPEQTLPLLINHKNIQTLYFKLYKVSTVHDNSINYDKENYQKFIRANRALKSWELTLPVHADHQTHQVMDKIDALPKGNYLLLALSDTLALKSASSYSYFTVSGMAVVNKTINYLGSHYYVLDAKQGNPIKGAVIQERTRAYTDWKSVEKNAPVLITNEQGFARSEQKGYLSKTVAIYKGDTVNLVTGNGRHHYQTKEKRIVFFTDRSIYRPGQTVFYKGFLIEDKDDQNTILPQNTIPLEFQDVNGKTLEKVSLTTNDYGTFQGSFNIPTGRRNGQMKIYSNLGQAYIQVEEYKRSTFELIFDPLNQQYKLNDSIQVKGSAMTFAGYAVGNAQLEYMVYRTATTWGSDTFDGGQVTISTGRMHTKTDGQFSFKFFADGDTQKQENYNYRIEVRITDINGETKTKSQFIKIGQKDIVLQAGLPAQLYLSKTPDSVPIWVSNLNGQGIKAKVLLEWQLLKAPAKLLRKNPFDTKIEQYQMNQEAFEQYFPGMEYAGESDPKNWMAQELRSTNQLTVAAGLGRVALDAKALIPGYYRVKIQVINLANDTLSRQKEIRIYGSRPEKILNLQEWLAPEKTTVRPNESAVFRIAGLPGSKAFYEVYYKDHVTERTWLEIGPHQQLVKIKAKPEFKDAIAVQFTMIQEGIVYNELQQINITDETKPLNIQFLSFRNKLQPGEKEKWKLKISNKNGEKETAEFVATLYDAALDDLKPMNWPSILNSAYNYRSQRWNLTQNNINTGSQLYFLSDNDSYFYPTNRKYEALSLLGFNYTGTYHDAYYPYVNALEAAQRKLARERAMIKLEKLAKENTLYGVVTDQDGFGLAGVVVSINKKQVTLTDKYGIYKIAAKNGDVIEYRFPGYDNLRIPAGKDKRLNAVLKNNASLREISGPVGRGSAFNRVVLRDVRTKPSQGFSKDHLVRTVRQIGQLGNLEMPVSGKTELRYDASNGTVSMVVEDTKVYDFASIDLYDEKNNIKIINGKRVPLPPRTIPRKNFDETAFFYPQLHTNENGEIDIEFTIPESLTRYKMMGFAHTKDLRTASISQDLITQKQVSISIQAPRFFREGDTILLSAKLNNLSGKELKGTASLELQDALNGKSLNLFTSTSVTAQDFKMEDKGSQALQWKLVIPTGMSALTYKAIAKSGNYSDGEEMTIPVLPNSLLITESLPLQVKGFQTKDFTMEKLRSSFNSKTLRSHSLTLEFTSNPVWYAIQALPHLMEYPYDCAEQTFSRLFANSFAAGIINSDPKIKQVFNQWQQNKSNAIRSDLEKNPELKAILLEETPWVRDAISDAERKKRLGVLFDLNRSSYELKSNLEKLEQMQNSNGSFPWFNGMNEDRYITQHIVLGFGQLRKLNLIDDQTYPAFQRIWNKATKYLDQQLVTNYKKQQDDTRRNYLPLHYLYASSYVKQKNSSTEFKQIQSFYLQQIMRTWKTMEPYQMAQAALILHRNEHHVEALPIIKLLKQTAQHQEELGMYWVQNKNGWYWHQNAIETQALLIEAFDEIGDNQQSVEEMKLWLLKHKQSNDWKTTKATAAACYALLMRGYPLLQKSAAPEITLAGQPLEKFKNGQEKEAGTGYEKVSIPTCDIKPEMSNVTVKSNSKTTSWGALYWQYYEDLDNITSAETGLKIKKELFLQQKTDQGDVLIAINNKNRLKVGDLVKIRIEIRSDQDMEYVHLKDMRAAGLEPVQVISQYKYQDGLGYYESTKDAATNFFINTMKKGVYVFEYPLRVSQAGGFSNGIATIQCMYAPEFSSHTSGSRIQVGP